MSVTQSGGGVFIEETLWKTTWISFQYEKMPTFCYVCGIMGHTFKECEERDGGSDNMTESDLPYGSFLRAGAKERTNMGKDQRGNRVEPMKYLGRKESGAVAEERAKEGDKMIIDQMERGERNRRMEMGEEGEGCRRVLKDISNVEGRKDRGRLGKGTEDMNKGEAELEGEEGRRIGEGGTKGERYKRGEKLDTRETWGVISKGEMWVDKERSERMEGETKRGGPGEEKYLEGKESMEIMGKGERGGGGQILGKESNDENRRRKESEIESMRKRMDVTLIEEAVGERRKQGGKRFGNGLNEGKNREDEGRDEGKGKQKRKWEGSSGREEKEKEEATKRKKVEVEEDVENRQRVVAERISQHHPR